MGIPLRSWLLNELTQIKSTLDWPLGKMLRMEKLSKPMCLLQKNYLREKELEEMGRIVNASLDMAESMAMRHIPMTMEDWAKRIDKFCRICQRFCWIRVWKVQDHSRPSFQSDFDRFDNSNLLPIDLDEWWNESPDITNERGSGFVCKGLKNANKQWATSWTPMINWSGYILRSELRIFTHWVISTPIPISWEEKSLLQFLLQPLCYTLKQLSILPRNVKFQH